MRESNSCEEKWVILMFGMSSCELSAMVILATRLAKERGDPTHTTPKAFRVTTVGRHEADSRKQDKRH
jgi:hypothetical protein